MSTSTVALTLTCCNLTRTLTRTLIRTLTRTLIRTLTRTLTLSLTLHPSPFTLKRVETRIRWTRL
jgi:hypothetical protein